MSSRNKSVAVAEVVITDELDRRPSRAPDYQAESQALAALAAAMSASPLGMLQQLVEKAMELTHADSAGISLLEAAGEQEAFRWVATAGAWAPYRDGTMPREQSPCREVIAREKILLVSKPERAFPALLQAEPSIGEGLLAPFQINGAPGGTVWVIKHDDGGEFDAEDARLLQSLAQFASAAHQMVLALAAARTGADATEARFRALATVGSSSVYRMSPDWREMRHLDGAAFLAGTNETTADWVETYIPLSERPRVREAINRAITDKDVFELEHRVLRADGTVGWTFSRAIPLLDDAGEISEWFGAATEVTARVKADRSFTRLFQASPAPFLVLKPDAPRFTITEVNDAYLSATMRTRNEVLGRGVFEAYPDNPADETVGGVSTLRASLDRMLASRQPDTLPGLKYDIARTDGTFEERWWSPVNSAVIGDDGEVEALIHNANDVTEARRAEIALRESEARYRTLFEAIDSGFCIFEMIFDESGCAVDYRFLEANSSFERQSGLLNAVGRRIREFAPDLEDHWFERYARVALTGEPMRVEGEAAPLGRWFDINAFRVGAPEQRRVAVLFTDISARRHADAALRDGEERQQFLLRLSDALRAEPSAEAITNRALRMLLEQLRLDRCYVGIYRLGEDIGEFPHQVHDDRLAPLPAQVRLSDFPEAFNVLSERTLVIDDIAKMAGLSDSELARFAALGVGALINATLRKGKNSPLWSLVAASAHPRVWTQGEVSLVEEVAERTWAAVERTRAEAALHNSEARFRQFSDASTNVLWIRNAATMRMEFASPAYDEIYGIPAPERGGDDRLRTWVRLIEPESRKAVLANFRRVRTGEQSEVTFRIKRASDGALRWIHCTDFPLEDGAGKVRWIAGLGADITDAWESANRQGVLVRELQHRTRNLIGVVRSVSAKTMDNAVSLEDFGERFEQRLSALSRVQGLLSHLATGKRVMFDELVRSELAAHGATVGQQVTLEGPSDVPLRSGSVQTLALALHELCTNAVKYGALRAAPGHLAIGWYVEPETSLHQRRLHIDWLESGVVMPARGPTPEGGGYGRELIERALPYQLKAETKYEFGPDGVRCTIIVPVSTPRGGAGYE